MSSSSSESEDVRDYEDARLENERPQKRRRLSADAGDLDAEEFKPAPITDSTVSRIKAKKETTASETAPKQQDVPKIDQIFVQHGHPPTD
jgi:hypothetical protein